MASTWGSSTWSSNSWGDVNNVIPVTGIGASASLGNETAQANADVTPTGIAMTASNGGVDDIVIATTGNPASILISANLGTADAGPDAMVTGLSTASMSLGTVDAFNLEGWGRQQWNTFAWGITGSLLTTGIAATANLGSIASITADASVIPTGIAMTASQGDESIEISFEIELTGQALTSNLGTADAGPDAMLTGIGGTASVGSVEAYNLEGWGRYFWGQFEWGATGEWESVTPTGISMSANVGTVVATPNTIATPSGIAITATLSEESVVGEATVELTGIGLTASINSVNALIWNEVNTGSAPLDPPGWREVPTRAA